MFGLLLECTQLLGRGLRCADVEAYANILKTNGNVMSMSLLIPEAQLEKILDGAPFDKKLVSHTYDGLAIARAVVR